MSGPKIDHVELERQRRAELERQRQERLRKIREETEKLNKLISTAKNNITTIEKHLVSETKVLENLEDTKDTLFKLTKLKDSYIGQLTNALEINVPAEPDSIHTYTQKLASLTKSIFVKYFTEIKPLEERVLDYSKLVEKQNAIKTITKDFSGKIEKMKSIEDFDFSDMADNLSCADIEPTVEEKARQILSEIEEMVNSESIQESDMKKLLAIAGNIYKTAFETKRFFEAAIIEYSTLKSSVIKNMLVFDELYQEYYGLYILWLDTVNENRSKRLVISPKEKNSFFSIQELEDEYNKLINETTAISERNYIRNQINTVMKQFDYNMAEELFFDSNLNKRSRDFIYQSQTERSAIHVHMSGEKWVMMEIVAIDKNYANSGNDLKNAEIFSSADLSGTERAMLVQEQGAFCKLHPLIVAELKKHGVLLNPEERKDVHERYAKKICFSSIFVPDSERFIEHSSLFHKSSEKQKPKSKKKQKQKLQLQAMK